MRLTEHQVIAEVETLSIRQLRLWVRRGWVVPCHSDEGPLYDEIDVARLRLVCQLKQEMAIGEEALPVVLSLMDQLHGLRRELKALARAVEEAPDEARDHIRRAYREQAKR